MYEERIIPPKKAMPQAQDGTLRKFALRVPEVIYQCSGIMVFGKRIKSLVFSTDLSIIKNVNADAIIAVYPFTPQPIITQALLLAADNVGRSIPILADDILVNFDTRRRAGAARALAQLAQHRQVILFTCHEEVVEALQEAEPAVNVVEL